MNWVRLDCKRFKLSRCDDIGIKNQGFWEVWRVISCKECENIPRYRYSNVTNLLNICCHLHIADSEIENYLNNVFHRDKDS